MYIRQELMEFAEEMEEVLRKNDYKTGWNEMTEDELFFRIKDEVEELEDIYLYHKSPISDRERKIKIQDMREEVIDIINFCMFFCINNKKVSD